MRLTHVHVENLFSFEDLSLDLSAHTTVILGPNASGKTNVLRAIELASVALRWAAEERPGMGATAATSGPAGRALEAYQTMSHLARGGMLQVRLGLRLDQDEEKELVAAFVRAALALGVRDELQTTPPDALIDSWASGVTAEQLAPLLDGELVAEHSGLPGTSWQVGLDFEAPSGSQRYRWVLAGPPFDDCVVPLDPSGALTSSPVQPQQGLLQCLFGIASPTATTTLPSPLPPFELDKLLGNAPGGPVALGARGLTVDWTHPLVVRFLTDLGAPEAWRDLQRTNTRWSLAGVLNRIWKQQVTVVGEQLRGVGPRGEAVPAVGSYSLAELAAAQVSTAPHLLPARLFRMANGDEADRRRFQEVCGLFGELSGGRQLAVRMEPLPLSGSASGATAPPVAPPGAGATPSSTAGPGAPATPEGGVLVDLLVTNGAHVSGSTGHAERPIQFCGAGTWEALVLAEALQTSAGSVVILDEPAVNLHPNWQRSVREYLSAGSAQAVVVTHAGGVVPLSATRTPDHETAIVRLCLDGAGTNAHRLEPANWGKIGRKLEAKGNTGLFFVERAILVEGQDDQDVVRILAERLGLEPEGAAWGVVECGGRENLPDYIGLCRGLGITYLAVMDGDATNAAAKKEVRDQVEQVRQAVQEGGGTLFGFQERIEEAFGLSEKNSNELRKKAETVDLTSERSTRSEIHELCERIKSFLNEGSR